MLLSDFRTLLSIRHYVVCTVGVESEKKRKCVTEKLGAIVWFVHAVAQIMTIRCLFASWAGLCLHELVIDYRLDGKTGAIFQIIMLTIVRSRRRELNLRIDFHSMASMSTDI